MGVDNKTFVEFKHSVDEQIQAINSQIQILRAENDAEIDQLSFVAFKNDILNRINAINRQIQRIQITNSSESPDVSYLRSEFNNKINAINRQIQQMQTSINTPADLIEEFQDMLNTEANAGKIKGYVINLSNLKHRVVLVYNNITRQFECEVMRTPKHIEEHIVNPPINLDNIGIAYSGSTDDGIFNEIFIDETDRYDINENQTVGFIYTVVAREVGGNGDNAFFKIEGAIQRNTGENVELIGTPTITIITRSNKVSWYVNASADTVNNALILRVKGESGKDINWNGVLNTVVI
jgi:hypothetical protein